VYKLALVGATGSLINPWNCVWVAAAGADAASACAVARGLCEASLRGTDSHGINLLNHYVKNLRAGGVNGKPVFKTSTPFPSLAVMDADNGFGLAAG
jgi:ureidoglycolate dehydrogenase (NAD+)